MVALKLEVSFIPTMIDLIHGQWIGKGIEKLKQFNLNGEQSGSTKEEQESTAIGTTEGEIVSAKTAEESKQGK